jgi:hypothetical protein
MGNPSSGWIAAGSATLIGVYVSAAIAAVDRIVKGIGNAKSRAIITPLWVKRNPNQDSIGVI